MSRFHASTLLVAAVAMFAFIAVAQAADKSHEGKVVSVSESKNGKDGKLVMVGKDGKDEHTHSILATAKITLNKKSAKLADLKKNDLVTVTLDDDDKAVDVSATRDAK